MGSSLVDGPSSVIVTGIVDVGTVDVGATTVDVSTSVFEVVTGKAISVTVSGSS